MTSQRIQIVTDLVGKRGLVGTDVTTDETIVRVPRQHTTRDVQAIIAEISIDLLSIGFCVYWLNVLIYVREKPNS